MSKISQKVRCACGLSKRMPWCDGAHQDETWFCEPKHKTTVNRAFYATTGLDNLAKRLAWRFDGMHLRYGEHVAGKQLVVIDDGSNIEQTFDAIADFDFEQVLYVGIDFDPTVIAQNLNIHQYFHVQGSLSDSFVLLEPKLNGFFNDEHPEALMNNAQSDIDKNQAYQNIFISHAVADEAMLLPVVESVRKLSGQSVFLCFDSIQKGAKWRRQIDQALQQSELFIAVISEHSVKSTYCAYEIGFAQALCKPMILVSIDGTLPPPFVSHIHSIDLCREVAAKPWLDVPSALKLALFDGIVKRV